MNNRSYAMKRDSFDYFFWGLGAFIACLFALIIFVVVDEAGGTDQSTLSGKVTGRYYTPPQTRTTVDGQGRVSTTTDPEEFHVYVEVEQIGNQNLSTDSRIYGRALIGAPATVVGRAGWMTGNIYYRLKSIGSQGGSTVQF
jgi:hypothetical protein